VQVQTYGELKVKTPEDSQKRMITTGLIFMQVFLLVIEFGLILVVFIRLREMFGCALKKNWVNFYI
jgi:hypothetical protein